MGRIGAGDIDAILAQEDLPRLTSALAAAERRST